MPFFEMPQVPFDDDDDDDDEDDLAYFVQPPYLGCVVPLNKVVALNDEVAVIVAEVVAYRDGFEIGVQWYLRGAAAKRSRNSPVSFGFATHHEVRGEYADYFLRVGLQYSNGTKVTNLELPWDIDRDGDAGMTQRSSGGSPTEYNTKYWVWPLPDEGPMKFVCEWPAFGITETAVNLDGAAVLRAGELSLPVWPDALDAPPLI